MEKLFILKNNNEFIIFENVTSPLDFLNNCKINFNNSNLFLLEVNKLDFLNNEKNCDKYKFEENKIYFLKYENVVRTNYLKWNIDLENEIIDRYFSVDEIEKINENKIYYINSNGDTNFPNIIEDKPIGESTEYELKSVGELEVLNVWI